MSKVKLPRTFLPKRIAKKFSDNRNHFLYNSIPSQINRSSWFWRITYLIQWGKIQLFQCLIHGICMKKNRINNDRQTYEIPYFLPNFTIHKKKKKEFQKSSVIPYPILRHTLRWFRQYCPLWKLGFILIYLGWYSWIWFDIAHDISLKRGINFILTFVV